MRAAEKRALKLLPRHATGLLYFSPAVTSSEHWAPLCGTVLPHLPSPFPPSLGTLLVILGWLGFQGQVRHQNRTAPSWITVSPTRGSKLLSLKLIFEKTISLCRGSHPSPRVGCSVLPWLTGNEENKLFLFKWPRLNIKHSLLSLCSKQMAIMYLPSTRCSWQRPPQYIALLSVHSISRTLQGNAKTCTWFSYESNQLT